MRVIAAAAVWRRLGCAAVLGLAGLVVPVAARAAAPPGAVAQLAGAAGCIRQSAGEGCATAPGLDGATAAAASPDAADLYVAGSSANAVEVLARAPSTGALTGVSCVRYGGGGGCSDGRGLAGADGIAVSPDGHDVYVAASRSNAVAVFTRGANGALTQLSGAAGCLSSSGSSGGCTSAEALDGAADVAVSSDGRNVYVASPTSDAVAVFTRNAATGALTQLAGTAGCIREHGGGGCASGIGLDGARALALSADGRGLDVAAASGDDVAALARDPATGALTQLAGQAGCVRNGGGDGCGVGSALDGADGITITGDGRTTYVAAGNSDAVVVLSRAPSGALAETQCVTSNGATRGCTTATTLDGAIGVHLSSVGSALYVAAHAGGALTLLARSSSGALTQSSSTGRCLREGGGSGCVAARALSGAAGLAVVGADVYVAADSSDAVAAFAPPVSATCPDITQPVAPNRASAIVLGCSSPSGGSLTRTIVANPAHGKLSQLNQSTGSILYTPTPGYVGGDQFTYRASDTVTTSAVATVRVNVLAPTYGPKVTILTRVARALPSGTARVRIACPPTAVQFCRVVLTVRSASRLRVGQTRRFVAFGTGTVRVGSGHTTRCTIRLTAKAKLLLARRRRLYAHVVATARDASNHRHVTGRSLRIVKP